MNLCSVFCVPIWYASFSRATRPFHNATSGRSWYGFPEPPVSDTLIRMFKWWTIRFGRSEADYGWFLKLGPVTLCSFEGTRPGLKLYECHLMNRWVWRSYRWEEFF